MVNADEIRTFGAQSTDQDKGGKDKGGKDKGAKDKGGKDKGGKDKGGGSGAGEGTESDDGSVRLAAAAGGALPPLVLACRFRGPPVDLPEESPPPTPSAPEGKKGKEKSPEVRGRANEREERPSFFFLPGPLSRRDFLGTNKN